MRLNLLSGKAAAILLVGWLVALVSRFIFGTGDESVLAYVSFGICWILTVAIIARSILALAIHREGGIAEHVLILGAFLALVCRAVITDGVAAHLLALIFVACVLGLAGYYARRLWGEVRAMATGPGESV